MLKMDLPRGWTKKFHWFGATFGCMHQKTVGMFLTVLLMLMEKEATNSDLVQDYRWMYSIAL